MLDKLEQIVRSYYVNDSDYPCLAKQVDDFKVSRPFEGLRVLHATPVFKNSVAKLLPLIAGGAELEMCLPPFLPFSPIVVDQLRSAGLTFIERPSLQSRYDLVLDCAGSRSDVVPLRGTVELTRSGEERYAEARIPWYSIDRSHIKLLEDMEGTAEGFIRGLKRFGCESARGKVFLLIGFGKVGRGLAAKLVADGAEVHAMDVVQVSAPMDNVSFFLSADKAALMEVGRRCDFIVTATGVNNCVQLHYPEIRNIVHGDAIFINMGATDEFGPQFNGPNLWNGGVPLNFALDEPTRLRFLDPVFALQNRCAANLASTPHAAGLHVPSHECQREIFTTLQERGKICLDSVSAFFS